MARKKKKEIEKKGMEFSAQQPSVQREVCLSFAEQQLFCALASDISHCHVVVEIANKAYESTKALASGAQSAGTRVFNVALYSQKALSEKSGSDSDARLDSETRRDERTNTVTFLDESAYDLSRRWKDTVALLLVIGYQHYQEVREAIVSWQPHLCPEAVVVIHNCHELGPARAIKEFISDGGNFVLKQTIDNVAVLVMDKCQHYWVIGSNEIGICRNCGRERNFRRLNRQATSLGIRKRTSDGMR
jgi:hypothetical protein